MKDTREFNRFNLRTGFASFVLSSFDDSRILSYIITANNGLHRQIIVQELSDLLILGGERQPAKLVVLMMSSRKFRK